MANPQLEDGYTEMISCCRHCNSELIVIRFSKGGYYVCDNWRCRLYRQRQVFIPNKARPDLGIYDEPEPEPKAKRKLGRRIKVKPRTRESYLELKRLNYQELRDRDYSCKDARDNCTIKKARAILGAKYG